MAHQLIAEVNGAGPTGALAALALSASGWMVTVHDPRDIHALLDHRRVYALTQSSRILLQTLGLWDALLPSLTPFPRLRLQDEGCHRHVLFTAADLGFRSSEPQFIGWILPHGMLLSLLLERLAADPSIHLQLGGAAGHHQNADLVVAADGSASPTRAALGIGSWMWPYRQACLTMQCALRGVAEQEAWELLRPEGPFAVLPLGEGQAQVVWSAPVGRCRQLESLPDTALLDALAGALPDALQPDRLLEQAKVFPVALQVAHRLHRGRTILVGESAHRCHPVGGQGLNLCWRDVAVLHRLATRAAAGRLKPARIGAAYAWRRWPDLLLTLLFTDLLVRVFSNRHPLLLPLRQAALALMARAGILRRLALRSMTLGPCHALGPKGIVCRW